MLNYRFYARGTVDTIAIAISNGLIKPDDPLSDLIRQWSQPWDGHIPEQSCDFDADQGLSKVWSYMGDFRPLDNLLGVDGVPESIRQHRDKFESLGLKLLRHVAVDFQSHTVNLYFRITGSVSEQYATSLAQLAVGSVISPKEYADMQRLLHPSGLTFAATINPATGEIKRVAFYALGIPANLLQDYLASASDRVKTFFEKAPSYEADGFDIIGWSFGAGGKNYLKVEKSYCGGVLPLFRGWNSVIVSGA